MSVLDVNQGSNNILNKITLLRYYYIINTDFYVTNMPKLYIFVELNQKTSVW
jgi:hypothetical protein